MIRASTNGSFSPIDALTIDALIEGRLGPFHGSGKSIEAGEEGTGVRLGWYLPETMGDVSEGLGGMCKTYVNILHFSTRKSCSV